MSDNQIVESKLNEIDDVSPESQEPCTKRFKLVEGWKAMERSQGCVEELNQKPQPAAPRRHKVNIRPWPQTEKWENQFGVCLYTLKWPGKSLEAKKVFSHGAFTLKNTPFYTVKRPWEKTLPWEPKARQREGFNPQSSRCPVWHAPWYCLFRRMCRGLASTLFLLLPPRGDSGRSLRRSGEFGCLQNVSLYFSIVMYSRILNHPN